MATVKVIKKDTRYHTEARLLEPHFVLRPQFWKVLALVQPVRHDDPDCERQLRPGRIAYNEAEHKGKIHCNFCPLPMTFYNAAKKAGAGNLMPAVAHLQKTPVARASVEFNNHDDNCPINLREMELKLQAEEAAKAAGETDEASTEIVEIKPKDRIMINEPGALNDHAERIADKGSHADEQPIYQYDRDSKKVRVVHPELVDRERVSVPDFESLKTLLANHRLDRLAESVVVANASITPFKNFVVRYASADGKHTPFHDLVERLRKGACHPVLMEARVATFDGKRFLSEEIDTGDGRKIIPQFWLDTPEARRTFAKLVKENPDDLKIAVLGVPRITTRGDKLFINVSIHAASQIGECDFAAVAREARRNQERRASHPDKSGRSLQALTL